MKIREVIGISDNFNKELWFKMFNVFEEILVMRKQKKKKQYIKF